MTSRSRNIPRSRQTTPRISRENSDFSVSLRAQNEGPKIRARLQCVTCSEFKPNKPLTNTFFVHCVPISLETRKKAWTYRSAPPTKCAPVFLALRKRKRSRAGVALEGMALGGWPKWPQISDARPTTPQRRVTAAAGTAAGAAAGSARAWTVRRGAAAAWLPRPRLQHPAGPLRFPPSQAARCSAP